MTLSGSVKLLSLLNCYRHHDNGMENYEVGNAVEKLVVFKQISDCML